MGNACCIGKREHEVNASIQVDSRDEIFNEEIRVLVRNMEEERADKSTSKPPLTQSEKRATRDEKAHEPTSKAEPTRKPALKQSEKRVTKFFKKVALCCSGNPAVRSVRVTMPPAPSVCGEETDAPSVVKVMCDGVRPKWNRPDLSGSYILDTTTGEMDTFLRDVGCGWAYRLAASAASYGSSRSTLVIEQTQTAIISVKQPVVGGKVRNNMSFCDESEQAIATDFGDGMAVSSWHGDVLVNEINLLKSGVSFVMRAISNDEGFLQEVISSSGTVATFVWRRV